MIIVNNITKSYGSQVLFKDTGFKLNDRERLGLVGRNGHGKTTLFRLITGEQTPGGGPNTGVIDPGTDTGTEDVTEPAWEPLPVCADYDEDLCTKLATFPVSRRCRCACCATTTSSAC